MSSATKRWHLRVDENNQVHVLHEDGLSLLNQRTDLPFGAVYDFLPADSVAGKDVPLHAIQVRVIGSENRYQ